MPWPEWLCSGLVYSTYEETQGDCTDTAVMRGEAAENVFPRKTVVYGSGTQPFWHQGPVSWKTIFTQTGEGDGFRMIQTRYIYCALHFYYYHIVIYNEIIIQLTIMQNQWEPWACFPAIRWSHLGVMRDSDTWRLLLMSGLLRKLQLNCHLPLTDRVLISVCKQLIYYGLCAVKPLC